MEYFSKLFVENRVMVLPKHTKVTEATVNCLDNLFEFATPHELKNDLLEIYLKYVMSYHEMLPEGFEKTTANLYRLIDFLSEVEEGRRKGK